MSVCRANSRTNCRITKCKPSRGAGWAGQKNGDLLRLMAGVFDIFIMIDNNLENQQQLANQPVGFVVLSAINNKLSTLLPLMPDVRAALATIQPGQVVTISETSEA